MKILGTRRVRTRAEVVDAHISPKRIRLELPPVESTDWSPALNPIISKETIDQSQPSTTRKLEEKILWRPRLTRRKPKNKSQGAFASRVQTTVSHIIRHNNSSKSRFKLPLKSSKQCERASINRTSTHRSSKPQNLYNTESEDSELKIIGSF